MYRKFQIYVCNNIGVIEKVFQGGEKRHPQPMVGNVRTIIWYSDMAKIDELAFATILSQHNRTTMEFSTCIIINHDSYSGITEKTQVHTHHSSLISVSQS